MTKKSVSGFTIVELLIATAVFAVVLLIAQASFLQIGHLFYRGISITNTQEAADHIFQDINGNFQSASAIEGAKDSSTGGYDYYCVGNTRYTYRIDNEVNAGGGTDHSATGNFGILKDTMKGAGTECPAPCNDAGGACPSGAPLKDPVEMLGDKMRVEQFDIAPSTTTSNLYNLAIVIAYGENSTLTYGTPGVYSTAECQGDLNNSFCAVSRINTSIYKGSHQ